MTHATRPTRRFRFAAFLLFVLACSLFLSLGEWLDLGFRGQLHGLDAAASWQVLLVCSAFGLLFSVPLALLFALWDQTLGPYLSLGARSKNALAALFSLKEPETAARRSVVFLAGLCSFATFFTLLYLLTFLAKSKLHAAALPIAVTIAVGGVGLALGALVLYRLLLLPFHFALFFLLRRFPALLGVLSLRGLTTLTLLLALFALPALWPLLPASWFLLDLRLPATLALWLLLLPLGLWLARSSLAASLLGFRHFVAVFGLVAAVLFILCQWACLVVLDRNMDVRERILDGAAFSKTIMLGAQKLVDFDRDGASPLYGGGDCDDFNPNVNPGADEIPDNGIDDNCLAGDYKTASQKKQDAAQTFTRDSKLPLIKHVFVLLAGGLRADMMSINGFSRPTTPALTRFLGQAQGSVNFQAAYAPSGQPFYSLAAMLYGRRPSQLNYAPSSGIAAPRLAESERSLGSILSARGYEAPLFLAGEAYDPSLLTLFRGFVEQEPRGEGSPEPAKSNGPAATSDGLIRYLSARRPDGRPQIVLAHFGDLLSAEKPPKPYAHFGAGPSGDYLGKVAYLDAELGRLLDWLESQGWLNNSAILISSTNGTALTTAPLATAGPGLSQARIHVPFLLYAPKAATRSVSQPVSLSSLAVTVFDLLGQPPIERTSGSSYLPFLDRGAIPAMPIISERLPDSDSPRRLSALLHGTYKLLYAHDSKAYQLFDLQKDPREENNLFARDPKLVGILLPILQQVEEQASVEHGLRVAPFIQAKPPSGLRPLDIHFEQGLDLEGYTISKDCLRRGEFLAVTLYWRARQKLAIAPTARIFVHIEATDEHGELHRFGADHEPAGGQYPFRDWRVGTLIKDAFSAPLPYDWPYGPARIWLGLHDRDGFDSELGRVELQKDGCRVAAISFKTSLDGQGRCTNLPAPPAPPPRKVLPKALQWLTDDPALRPFLILDLTERLRPKTPLPGPRPTTAVIRLN